MTDRFKKILSISSTVLIVIVILLAVIVSFLFSKSDDDVPSPFGLTAFAIQTDSMEDTINVGDFIIGKKCDTSKLKKGDIISFYTVNEKDGKIFINTHRIHEVVETSTGKIFITKGDNTPDVDPRSVSEGDVICKYTGFRVPLLGTIITFLSTQLGFFLCIVLPVLLYTIWQIYKLITVIMHNQKVKMIKEVNEEASDAVKEAIIAEYLAKQKEEEEKNKSNTE